MKIYKREKYLEKVRPFYDSDLIKIITGIRRCGKSCILKLIVDELKQKGVSSDHIIYIQLDKKNFKWIKTPEQLESVIDSYIKDSDFYYLFVDEVQNVKGFEAVIQGYQEEENFSIFLTGSNSYLLSDEISTKLTGRYIKFEIYTLDFQEYEEMKTFHGYNPSPDRMEEFKEFIVNGGFPKSLEFKDQRAKQLYTESIINEIFEKDIKKRNKIRNKPVFERIQNYLIGNYGATFSLKSVYEYFRDIEKINVTKTTIRKYIEILVSAKILYKCERFDQKSKRILSGECKFYLADLSIFFAMNVDNRINFGASLENIVYLYLLSNGYKVSVGRIGKFECDFITRDLDNQYAYIQVSQTVADKSTEEREYRPFSLIRDGYPRYLLTLDTLKNQRDGVKHLDIIDVITGKVKI